MVKQSVFLLSVMCATAGVAAPVTKIKYSIPQNVGRETRNVSLKIYDVLGGEVATLANEEKPAGEYEVEFNATNLPSGI